MKLFLLISIWIATVHGASVITGAQNSDAYRSALNNKNIAVVVNQSSMVSQQHLVDLLLGEGVSITRIFAPEHGFRGQADAGEHVQDGVDKKSALPIISLYGKHKKPSAADLKGIDIILFDIQDVGVRFYTYLSTLHYVMEAAAENNVSVMVLDRPNPNGNRIDGPLLQKEYRSFVGLDPVPILYGMTIGEYARMINGEGWLNNGVQAELTVVKMQNYRRSDPYHLPIKPSPNLPNDLSVALYPSLALFEGTVVSAGRGTEKQFQLYGAPGYMKHDFSFIPVSKAGAKYPKYENKRCYGVDLSGIALHTLRSSSKIDLSYLLDAYKNYRDKKIFFYKNGFFDRLAGTDKLRKQIIANASVETIRKSWEEDLKHFRTIRKKYLIYPE